MRWVKAALSLVLLAAATWALQTPHGIVPPLGKLVNPFAGFWRNNASVDRLPGRIALPGLVEEARVVWDDLHVPHIFARNGTDLAMAQGYVMARDRLWQMEFIARFAGGRLSEIVGPKALEQDRFQRRIGMTFAAENFLKGIESDPEGGAVLKAYAEGVNAYIRTLSPAEYPVEFKILDYAPEPWTPMKTALLLKYMAWDLTGFSLDWALTRLREAKGEAIVDELFPYRAPFQDPIVPPGTKWNAEARTPAPQPSGLSAPPPAAGNPNAAAFRRSDPFADFIGSNNWALAGSKTKNGFPLLANDPHLELSLPSIWYPIQLSSPDLNAFGVALPGAPGIIIGFNEHIAWGTTNAGSDVLDWYKIRFKDASRAEYFYDGGWRPTTVRREEIGIKGRGPLVEEVLYTHHGPVPFPEGGTPVDPDVPAGCAMRWKAHDPSGVLTTFLLLNRAKSYEDFRRAIETFDCPAQNFVFAGKDGGIALWHNGEFPLRDKGKGRYILDGSSPADEWPDCVPMSEVPRVENPARGFVSSANQSPADATFPHYLGWDYATFERGARINELLAATTAAVPEDMVAMQTDALSLRARMALPKLLAGVPKTGLVAAAAESREKLFHWDFVFHAEGTEPTVFDRFWREFSAAVWNDDLGIPGSGLPAPRSDVTLSLLLDKPDSPYFDDTKTTAVETFADIAGRAFTAAIEGLERDLGPLGEKWTWGKARPTEVRHLARIPGFGTRPLPVSGGGGTINSTSRTSGPSWRMVVSLGPVVEAWGIFPGGTSGHPGSRYYDNLVADWAEGKTQKIVFLKSADEAHPRLIGTTELRGLR
jgi:penicillin amidase